MKYAHRFRVEAPSADVVEFHQRSASMAAITPPPIIVRIHEAPAVLGEGDEMAFTLWLGPLPMRWRARIEQTGPSGFADRLIKGPFASWVHQHVFVETGSDATEVIDMVSAKLSDRPFWRLAGLALWAGMPLLFTYRAWKTRRLLQRPSVAGSSPARTQGAKR
ncbi:MAG: hypothetical protein QM346_11260 [Chloroflexota bacterium]|nr:hypothetical protein [Chloroflexota bacterium]